MTVSKKLIENVEELRKALNEISVYDFDVYTSMELYYKIAEKLNEVIKELSRFEGLVSDEVIKQNEKLIYLLGEGLNIEVVKKINQMIEDGTMESIINHNVFNSLYTQINEKGVSVKPFYKNNWSDAINNAIKYANENNIGCVVLPGGDLEIDKPIEINQSIKIKGQSRVKTVLKPVAHFSDYVIKVIGGGSTVSSINRLTFEDLKIDLNKSLSLGGIYCDWCYILQFKNIEITNAVNPSAKLFYLSNVFNCLLTSCRASINNNEDGTGFYITSTKNGENVTQVKMTDCLAQYCNIGVHVNMITGSSEISYENSGMGKNTTNMLIEGNVSNVDVRLNHIERATNGIVATGDNVRCINIELNDFFDVTNSIILNDGVRYIDIKNNRYNGNNNSNTILTANGTVKGIVFYNNNILSVNTRVFNVGTNNIVVLDEDEYIHNTNVSAITGIPYGVKHYRFQNTANVQIGNIPASYHNHTVTFYFDDFSRFYESSRMKIQRQIGLSDNSITMRYNAYDDKWYEVTRYEKAMNLKPTTGNFGGGMIVWNENRYNTGALYWCYIDGAWRDFNIISI